MVRWLRWHCPQDTGFEIRALAVWGRARYLSVTEAPHNTNFHTWMGKKQLCFFQTAETGNRTPDSGVKGSGTNHYPRAPAQFKVKLNLKGTDRSWVIHPTQIAIVSNPFFLNGSSENNIIKVYLNVLSGTYFLRENPRGLPKSLKIT